MSFDALRLERGTRISSHTLHKSVLVSHGLPPCAARVNKLLLFLGSSNIHATGAAALSEHVYGVVLSSLCVCMCSNTFCMCTYMCRPAPVVRCNIVLHFSIVLEQKRHLITKTPFQYAEIILN